MHGGMCDVHVCINMRKSSNVTDKVINIVYVRGIGRQRFWASLLIVFLISCLDFFLLFLLFNTFGKTKVLSNMVALTHL